MSDMSEPLAGLRVSRDYYVQVVGPLLDELTDAQPHSAALIGPGSEVLGYDDFRSTDHDWGPRVRIFYSAPGKLDSAELRFRLLGRLPEEFSGYSTRFGLDSVEIFDIEDYLHAFVGFDPRSAISLADWLTTPSQLLLEFTSGEVFHDGLGQLSRLRSMLEWYPDDVWLYLIACQWKRISQEEAFVGRTFEVGDEIGSRVVIARLVRDLMRLCHLFERTYAPYSKWLGSSFRTLSCFEELSPLFDRALGAKEHSDREVALAGCYQIAGQMHNDSKLTRAVDPTPRTYHDRPFQVVHAERYVEATMDAITDPEVLALPKHVGSIDQFVDSTDVLGTPRRTRSLSNVYEVTWE